MRLRCYVLVLLVGIFSQELSLQLQTLPQVSHAIWRDFHLMWTTFREVKFYVDTSQAMYQKALGMD